MFAYRLALTCLVGVGLSLSSLPSSLQAQGGSAPARRTLFAARNPSSETLTDDQFVAFGQYEGVRKGTGTKMVLNCRKLTYTSRGVFTLGLWVEPASDKERKWVSIIPGFHTEFLLSLEEYVALFHETAPAEMSLPKREPVGWVYDVTGRTEAGVRTVTFAIAIEDDYGREDVGSLVLKLRDGAFISAAVRKHRKILFIKKTVLDASSASLDKTMDGLLLRDEGLVGCVKEVGAMRQALAEPKPEVFQALVR